MSLDPAAKMVDFVLQLQPQIIPAECLEIAQRCLLDFFAVALAGSREPLAGALAQYLAEQKGEASVIGGRYKTSLEGAAFANGTLGHIRTTMTLNPASVMPPLSSLPPCWL